MPRYRVKCEFHDYVIFNVDAESEEEAEQKACRKAWSVFSRDVYNIESIEMIDSEKEKE